MGSARNVENPYARHWHAPKMSLTGRLWGTLDGRPVVIDADESGVMLDVTSFRSAWTLRKYGVSALPFLQFVKSSSIPLTVRVAGTVSLPVLPRPSVLIRVLAPTLARL